VGHTVSAATPIPVGTPGAFLENAFGPKYEGFAVANVAASAGSILKIV
jgi:hypothetical protein